MASEEDTVYSRFKVIKDGTEIKLRIQNARKQDQARLLDCLCKWYLPEEAFIRCAGVPKSEEAKNEVKVFFKEMLADEVTPTLVCYVDNEEEDLEIVGCNIFILSKRDENPPFDQIKTAEVKSFIGLITVLDKVYDLFTSYNVDRYLVGAGLSVNPSYRGSGIATELLKARKPFLQKLGVPMTGAWLTATGSQKAAHRAGYEQVAEIQFEELGRLSGIQFTDVPDMCVFSILEA